MRKVYISNSKNPYFNLALEAGLTRRHQVEEEILFLWQNHNTVVIGRNQNPWKECNLEELKRQKGYLVRRLSGGGAVYHDEGNLNYTFISSFAEEQLKDNISFLIDVLRRYGIAPVFGGRNDIVIEDCKVSGTAFFVEENVLCHHGSILLNTNLEKLSRLLTVSEKKLESKGIDSVRSRVKNLCEWDATITVESLKEDLAGAFLVAGNSEQIYFVSEETEEAGGVDFSFTKSGMKEFSSWDWNFGETPEFNIQISERFPWGGVDLYLLVQNGMILDATVNTDALDIRLPAKIKERIWHQALDYGQILEVLSGF